MTLLAVGINYNTAPVSIRERLAFPADILETSLQDLWRLNGISEAAILSTCNRTEFYCESPTENKQLLIDWVADNRNIKSAEFAPYLYIHQDSQLIRHMFRVACGLDSMILGEPQILGQMKTAYQAASEAGTLGKYLGKLFQYTFSAAKKVRTDTAIGSSPVSIAFAAVQLAQQIFDKLSEQTAILIGAGETIELTARHLSQHGIGRIIIANRTFDKAHALASRYNGYAISLTELPTHLAEADIVVSSTASQLPILGKGSVESAIKKRKHKPMFMVDLAVPRDIEAEVEQLKDVYLYTVDDLQNTIDQNMDNRRRAALQAEEIIDTEVEHFLSWLRAQGAQNTIRDYRLQAESIRDEALFKTLKMLNNGLSAEEALNRLAHSLTNKLIHTPSAQIREAGANERHDLIAAAREIFKLSSTQ
ncbi:glutamyl-tRNA reductase [Methylicorpusculum sp.]|uniref:glutamyl-tRNA reductase n=1 Tax=Methylicorpusculum sp. TaxID=2713644 RepID=UPI002716CEC5|nr:glutamyl-tRNA reductase [Methylicorpusculum sp.]MDO8844568.1 glutamyl-tRNA reductase [Methylicorpusculum sp.]MDO9241260.1 glutamyl-tRNA reductase [Methylicorpusculum sp.]MDP2177882.1 glutamyl-tRNA reductase [Methylicorpusculum sp.]MDP3529302.1 glutamyl-tRNA reductase [Methylicorpusculum sp.]MDZ4152049.1 glutamyl-tRNA reductase [Methylicorpusculum sp.]